MSAWRAIAVFVAAAVILAGIPARPAVAAPPVVPPAQSSPSPCAIAAAAALSKRFSPYIWGAKGPNAFDCSGLTSWAWAQAGRTIGISTFDQATVGRATSCRLSDLNGTASTCWEVGDLIFLRDGRSQHVAIYLGDGLFADAYNTSTGVIVHRVEQDSYYHAHFWQARRVMDCAGTAAVPDLPTSTPPLEGSASMEDIPDLLPSVVYRVPQCNDCDPAGVPLLPPREWGESWPAGWELLNLALVVQKVGSWMAWQVSQIAREVLCWLLFMLQILVDVLLQILNAILIALNAIWKTLVLLLLGLRSAFYGLFGAINILIDVLDILLGLLDQLLIIVEVIWDVFVWIGAYLLTLIEFLWVIVQVILNIVGWIGALLLGIWLRIMVAMSATTVPTLLVGTDNPIYWMVRGGGEAITQHVLLGALYWLTIAAIYAGAIFWSARFLSGGRDA